MLRYAPPHPFIQDGQMYDHPPMKLLCTYTHTHIRNKERQKEERDRERGHSAGGRSGCRMRLKAAELQTHATLHSTASVRAMRLCVAGSIPGYGRVRRHMQTKAAGGLNRNLHARNCGGTRPSKSPLTTLRDECARSAMVSATTAKGPRCRLARRERRNTESMRPNARKLGGDCRQGDRPSVATARDVFGLLSLSLSLHQGTAQDANQPVTRAATDGRGTASQGPGTEGGDSRIVESTRRCARAPKPKGAGGWPKHWAVSRAVTWWATSVRRRSRRAAGVSGRWACGRHKAERLASTELAGCM